MRRRWRLVLPGQVARRATRCMGSPSTRAKARDSACRTGEEGLARKFFPPVLKHTWPTIRGALRSPGRVARADRVLEEGDGAKMSTKGSHGLLRRPHRRQPPCRCKRPGYRTWRLESIAQASTGSPCVSSLAPYRSRRRSPVGATAGLTRARQWWYGVFGTASLMLLRERKKLVCFWSVSPMCFADLREAPMILSFVLMFEQQHKFANIFLTYLFLICFVSTSNTMVYKNDIHN